MAIIARFSFDVPFGQKSKALEVAKKFEWLEQEFGWPKCRRAIGSIGAPESRVEEEYVFDSISALDEAWSKLNHPKMGEFMQEMAPYVVPGSHRWEVLRISEG